MSRPACRILLQPLSKRVQPNAIVSPVHIPRQPPSSRTHPWSFPSLPSSSLRHSSSSSFSPSPGQRYTAASSTRSQLLRPTTILLIFVPILTGFLGVWQIKRLRWKLDLIEEVERNLEKAPMYLPDHVNLAALPDFAFRRVLVRGKLASPPILYGPQTRDGVPGYALIQPLIRSSSVSNSSSTSDGAGASTILLNRGFITSTRANLIRQGAAAVPGLNPDGSTSEEEVVVEGMLTKAAEKSSFTLENNKKNNEWFFKDVEEMAEWCGGKGKGIQAVLVDAIEDGDNAPTLLMQQGIPVGRPAHVEIRNQHATYAATWLSLSAATSVMLVYVLRKGKAARQPTRPRLRL